MRYEFNDIEAKWQTQWNAQHAYKVAIDHAKPKYYVLDMFPYPSGAGLHVGHPLGYIASDIVSRYKRMQGYNVLHPMGYDAFGLPAEQYAIETGQHPAVTTARNIKRFREQLDKLGFSFDWSRQVSTCEPQYYKWTQWAVIRLFHSWYDHDAGKARPIEELAAHFASKGSEQLNAACSKLPSFTAKDWASFDARQREEILLNYRLIYLSEAMVNWCPGLGTVLANDEVAGGYSVRGNHPVEQKKMQQWALRVTAYAERLLNGLEKIDWPEAVVEAQRNWIGRSKGAQVFFPIDGHDTSLEIFTTRPDTIFGASFMVIAPEHPLVEQLTTAEQKPAVQAYQAQAKLLSERERIADVKRISGVFTGCYCIHPFSGEQVPIWISDYVIASYGTGAIMAVPAHDERDFAFAKHFHLSIPTVVSGSTDPEQCYEAKSGMLIHSDFLNGLEVPAAIVRAIEEIERRGMGKGVTQYRLRDAIFSRQRFWGEPFPIFYRDGLPQTLPDSALPLALPEVDKYLPTAAGDPPLGRAQNWQTAEGYPFDLNTMPGFAGSSAYFLRYMDPHNDQTLVSREAVDYWQDVDLYIGGREHATGHLIYSRFWNMFLYDLGVASKEEPFRKLVNQGMITGRSSLVYRVKGQNRFISLGLVEKGGYDVAPVHVDISLVKDDVLDLEAFRNWRPEFKDASFELEGDKYRCGWAIEKMSKSLYNVTSPDDVVRDYGADTLRLYEMFLGPLDQSKPWKNDGIEGVHRFLKRFWAMLVAEDGRLLADDHAPREEEERLIHPLLKKVKEDLDSLSFNTSVSAFMIALNGLLKLDGSISKLSAKRFVCALAPFAPHIAEELWQRLGGEGLVIDAKFPAHEERWCVSQTITYPVSVNGKTRATYDVPLDYGQEQLMKLALEDPKVAKLIEGKTIRKVIFVERRMLNIVV